MDTELIIFNEYCQKSHTDPTFIISLEEGGLIEIRTVDGERYLLASSSVNWKDIATCITISRSISKASTPFIICWNAWKGCNRK